MPPKLIFMNIHEYQAKDILKKFGVAVQRGIVADTPDKALAAAKELGAETGSKWFVIKSQIHAGGRGKGTIKETGSRGVVLAKSFDEVLEKSKAILGGTLVTIQTGPAGKKVNKVLIAEDVYYPGEVEPKEYYMSILLDRATSKPVIMASTEGGMNIEEVAETHPEKIVKEWIDPSIGLQPFQARKIAFKLGLEGNAYKEMIKFVNSLYAAYIGLDASMFEINPVLKTSDNKILAVDGKVNLDDNALFRHKDLEELRDISEEDPLEVEAGKSGLNYVKLDGNVGCMVNGAGLAMATMDIIKISGGEPANFLDVGGGATTERVTEALKLILANPKVKAILVNIFGGIVRCDLIAEGIINAVKDVGLTLPVVVRLEGTNVDKGRELLRNSVLKITSATDLSDAAQKVVAAANGAFGNSAPVNGAANNGKGA